MDGPGATVTDIGIFADPTVWNTIQNFGFISPQTVAGEVTSETVGQVGFNGVSNTLDILVDPGAPLLLRLTDSENPLILGGLDVGEEWTFYFTSPNLVSLDEFPVGVFNRRPGPIDSIPEPATLSLLAAGLLAGAAFRKRFK